MLEVVDQTAQEDHEDLALFETLVRALRTLDDAEPGPEPDRACVLPPSPRARRCGPPPRRLRLLRQR